MSKRWLALLAMAFCATLTAYASGPSVVVDQLLYSGFVDPTVTVTNTTTPDITTLETYLQGLTPTSTPNWPYLGYAGFLLKNQNVSGFPYEVQVFNGVIQIRTVRNGTPLYYQDVHGLEAFLTTLFPPVPGVPAPSAENRAPGSDAARNQLNPMVPGLPTNGSEPPYNPGAWNDDDGIQYNNNCYNYGANKMTGTFAQPGRAGGRLRKFPATCSDVIASADTDGLIPWPASFACPSRTYKVALVTQPAALGGDYHWYRQNPDGTWSHKRGGSPAKNVDESGNPITDPRTADRDDYSNFCGFMCVMTPPSMVNISADPLNDGVIQFIDRAPQCVAPHDPS
jgi:hypothetical protein